MTETIIEARGISKAFGVVQALDDVDIVVQPGEVVALAGENGSGKSTLARILAGVLAHDSGSVRARGRAVTFSTANDAIAAGVALVSQEPTVVPALSIAENVLLHELHRPGRIYRRRDFAARAAHYLSVVGLDVDPQLPFESLKPGQYELAEVARALATDPDLLILDEATTRLPDPEHLFAVVERLARERGMATLLITHRLREIRRLCDRAVVLRDGRLAGELGRGELSDEEISKLMVGRGLDDFFARAETGLGDVVLSISGLVTDRSPVPIDLEIRAGEVVGIAGLVGSGRSELLETIAGLGPRQAGRVHVDGGDLSRDSVRVAMAAGVALVAEDRWSQGLIRHDTITSNLALASHRVFRRTRRRHDRAVAHRAVDRYSIRCRSVDAPVASLSGGNAQKVVLARAVDRDLRVLLLDEPTRGVDIGAKAGIYEVIGELTDHGVAVLVASSDLLELLGICDRILGLYEGEVVGEVTGADASEETLAYLVSGGGRT